MQQRLHPGEQFRGTEGFRHVIVSSRLERSHPLGLERARGQHDDRQVGPGTYVPDQLNSISIGQAQINDGEIGALGFGLTHREAAGTGSYHPHAVRLGKKSQDVLNSLIVLDDEYDAHPRVSAILHDDRRINLPRHGQRNLKARAATRVVHGANIAAV